MNWATRCWTVFSVAALCNALRESPCTGLYGSAATTSPGISQSNRPRRPPAETATLHCAGNWKKGSFRNISLKGLSISSPLTSTSSRQCAYLVRWLPSRRQSPSALSHPSSCTIAPPAGSVQRDTGCHLRAFLWIEASGNLLGTDSWS